MATAPAHYRVGSDVERGADHVRLGGFGVRGWAMAVGIGAPDRHCRVVQAVGEMVVVGGGGMTLSG